MKLIMSVSLVFLIALFLTFTASSAYASTNLSISGNGSGSENSVQVTANQSTTVSQSNFWTVFNSIFARSSTGDNDVSKNVGDSTITTGDSTTKVTVTTTGGSNYANIPCCGDAPAVPEFGVIPGAIALLSSGGAFLFLKKRAISR